MPAERDQPHAECNRREAAQQTEHFTGAEASSKTHRTIIVAAKFVRNPGTMNATVSVSSTDKLRTLFVFDDVGDREERPKDQREDERHPHLTNVLQQKCFATRAGFRVPPCGSKTSETAPLACRRRTQASSETVKPANSKGAHSAVRHHVRTLVVQRIILLSLRSQL